MGEVTHKPPVLLFVIYERRTGTRYQAGNMRDPGVRYRYTVPMAKGYFLLRDGRVMDSPVIVGQDVPA